MITVYTAPNCQPCRLTKAKLDTMGVEYAAHDVSSDESARRDAAALGYREMPVVVNGDDHWSGFRPDKLAALGGGE